MNHLLFAKLQMGAGKSKKKYRYTEIYNDSLKEKFAVFKV